MLIRNKKTGAVVVWDKPIQFRLGKKYNSLKEFNEDWEDVSAEDIVDDALMLINAGQKLLKELSRHTSKPISTKGLRED